MDAAVKQSLEEYRAALGQELQQILSYWQQYTVDEVQGGFYGKVMNDNNPDPSAPRGIVLYSRILWTFSAAYNHSKNVAYLSLAERAFDYILEYFHDKQNGGVYWSVTGNGKMQDGKKQIYGLAFCIYGMSEFYKAGRNEDALDFAKSLTETIEKYSYDHLNGGYLEAFTADWKPMADLRLSEKDANEKKTMNTHLHVIEAYANLYTVWPDTMLRNKIIAVLDVFEKYFIDHTTGHLHLFMNEEWQVRPDVISYGHDIEAAWLLLQCAEIIGDTNYIERFQRHSILIAKAAARGLDLDGGLWYEFDTVKNILIKEKHWWPQAEAMIGFLNAYQLDNNEINLQRSLHAWKFIQKHIKDNQQGEWHWGVYDDYRLMEGQDKAGFWKCPYHNSRACIELMQRIQQLLKT